MKIKQEITETIEAEIDLSKPLFFKSVHSDNIWFKFIEENGKLIKTNIFTVSGLTINVSEAYGNDFRIVSGRDNDFSHTTADEYYKALNEAINKYLPLSAEELVLTSEQIKEAEQNVYSEQP